MKKQILSLAAGAALVFAAQNSFATAVSAGSFGYQVILTGGCTVTTAASGTLTLGNQSSYAGTPIANAPAGTVVIKCSNMPYGICVNGGMQPAAGSRNLKLGATANTLAYDLKVGGTSVGDKGCQGKGVALADSAAWADPVGGAITAWPAGINGNGADQTYNLTADVPSIPVNTVPGTYTDTVDLNVVF